MAQTETINVTQEGVTELLEGLNEFNTHDVNQETIRVLTPLAVLLTKQFVLEKEQSKMPASIVGILLLTYQLGRYMPLEEIEAILTGKQGGDK